MYRTVQDFVNEWSHAAVGTIKVLEAMSDEKLGQSIVEGHSSLGWLGWHLTTSPMFFAGMAGLSMEPVGDPKAIPTQASEIVTGYKTMAERLKNAAETLTDEQMVESVDTFAGPTPRGAVLRMLIDHQTHHRGQMTVLLRQAGLTVPGVIGPTREEQMKMK
ncbi:DinB family protein [Paenibacillus sp. KQZ6P-2]|uniref:DinB family protein n=1 Tax=Paenibacillus mangrovi TaxID=2931978 RepID=A0A9X1WKK0_9BACL|nr:DinB family protein [Paenibacillus mangrovi]MCJ8011022.1 DinB family protein [Paenibacillus mangrovi]